MSQDYLLQIEKIKEKFPIIQKEIFVSALNGTHYKVFVSDKYVIRFRDDNPELLSREVSLLKQLNHPLVPKVLWVGKIDNSTAMIENRFPGETLNRVWKTLPEIYQSNIIQQAIEFLQFLKTQTKEHVYSVYTGKNYTHFSNYLTDELEQKVVKIKKFNNTEYILKDILLIIEEAKKTLLFEKKNTILVHGDLIIHNLLTDGENLTGILDWELALFGDSDYDLCRLFYYQECAKAYQHQENDESFEADYMNKLINAILKSTLIENKNLFQKKYAFVRAIFYLNALYWASGSNNPEKNITELVTQWNKK